MKRRSRVALINLGCPKNQVDGERVFADYAQKGLVLSDPENADVLLINTCAFIQPAVLESVKHIRRAIRRKNEGILRRIIVLGCLPERVGEGLKKEFPEIDELTYKEALCSLEGNRAPRVLTTFPHAYLKIAEGCNRECSFCLIPQLRGGFRSLSLEQLLKEARDLRAMGIQEIVLVAQDTTIWGADLSGKPELLTLVEKISFLGFPWVRLLYLHPQLISKEFLLSLKSIKNVVPYLDIPLQHVDSKILASMGRGQSEKEVRKLVETVRANWPEAALRSSFIVGFPGEGAREFKKLKHFLTEVQFERLALFPFYAEKGTRAWGYPDQVAHSEKLRRYQEVQELQKEIYRRKNKALVGKKEIILIDRTEGSTSTGRTFRDAPEIDCEVRIRKALEPGEFCTVRVTKANIFSLIGEIEEEGGDGKNSTFRAG